MSSCGTCMPQVRSTARRATRVLSVVIIQVDYSFHFFKFANGILSNGEKVQGFSARV